MSGFSVVLVVIERHRVISRVAFIQYCDPLTTSSLITSTDRRGTLIFLRRVIGIKITISYELQY